MNIIIIEYNAITKIVQVYFFLEKKKYEISCLYRCEITSIVRYDTRSQRVEF